MLKHSDQKEQATAAECIWTLSFDKNVRQAILEFPDLVPALEELASSTTPPPSASPSSSSVDTAGAGSSPSLASIVRKNVQGALWLIKGDNDPSNNVGRELLAIMKKAFFIFIPCKTLLLNIIAYFSVLGLCSSYKEASGLFGLIQSRIRGRMELPSCHRILAVTIDLWSLNPLMLKSRKMLVTEISTLMLERNERLGILDTLLIWVFQVWRDAPIFSIWILISLHKEVFSVLFFS